VSAHVHGKRSPFTDVTETGITFTVCDCGILLGGVAPLGKRLVSNLLTGKIRVTTPHRAGGAYRERGAGGVYATINPKARLLTLAEQMDRDPRAETSLQGRQMMATIRAAYGVN
jgi:hypothetical protein